MMKKNPEMNEQMDDKTEKQNKEDDVANMQSDQQKDAQH